MASKYEDWAFSFKRAVRSSNCDAHKMLVHASSRRMSWIGSSKACGWKTFLPSCTGDAFSCIRAVDDVRGLTAWQRLYKKYNPSTLARAIRPESIQEFVYSSLAGDRPPCRGGGAQYLSGFAPDREAKSRPRVTVAGGPGGPMGDGKGPPNRAHGRRIIEPDCTTLLITGPRCKLLRLQEWTQPFHRGHGVGGPHKTTIMFTVLLAASAATANPTRGYLSRSR